MSLAKKILLAVGIVLIIIQFIQPKHNTSVQIMATDISKTVSISDSVKALLKITCYDCHSNNTNYPWYSNIQPMGWLMANHIKKGKEELNLSEFGGYSPRRQVSKLNGIANSIKDDIMPLSSYKLMHKNAQLSANEKMLVINWAQQSKDSLSAKIGGFDHSTPEIIQLSKQLVDKHLMNKLGGQNIPAGTGHYHRFFK